MSGKKDINRIRELIFGKELASIDKKFEKIEEQLTGIKDKQATFYKNAQKYYTYIEKHLNKLKDHDGKFLKRLDYHENQLVLYTEEINKDINAVSKKTKDELKTLKAELKMHIESKINGLDRKKISNAQLSEMFATLSHELNDTDEQQQHKK